MIDIYTHIMPERFFAELTKTSPKLGNIGARMRAVKPIHDLDVRFRLMDGAGTD
jgi:aminocarboxymuconate-semialdehyde decarboxylase